ncbi:Protein PHF-10 b [Aphelenchoides avenae]|nr:Protein PHF-10 b [Aphelenchus avenae]
MGDSSLDPEESSNDANASPLEPTTESKEDSPTSASEGDSRSKKSISKQPSAEAAHVHVEASHIIEYQWPLEDKNAEKYLIQEQIAEVLGVKSFKRKYPDLQRRQVEPAEREHLIKQRQLGAMISPHLLCDLTALRADEVYDLMEAEYPEVFQEYQKVVAERVKQEMAEKQRQLDMIKMDAKKMEELRKNSIRNAFQFNSDLQAVRKTERRYFWDIQTSIIQSPANRWRKMPKEFTRPSPYPVALIPGQFTGHYKRYSPEMLRTLPVSTVLKNEELFPPRRDASPPPVLVSEQELRMNNGSHPVSVKSELLDMDSAPPSPPKTPRSAGGRRSNHHAFRPCSVCGQTSAYSITCAQCGSTAHPKCLEMTDAMARVVLQYAWCCMECKSCTQCGKPTDEELMMCCESCDRGYHCYCVGLKTLPEGKWVCTKYCKHVRI